MNNLKSITLSERSHTQRQQTVRNCRKSKMTVAESDRREVGTRTGKRRSAAGGPWENSGGGGHNLCHGCSCGSTTTHDKTCALKN